MAELGVTVCQCYVGRAKSWCEIGDCWSGQVARWQLGLEHVKLYARHLIMLHYALWQKEPSRMTRKKLFHNLLAKRLLNSHDMIITSNCTYIMLKGVFVRRRKVRTTGPLFGSTRFLNTYKEHSTVEAGILVVPPMNSLWVSVDLVLQSSTKSWLVVLQYM